MAGTAVQVLFDASSIDQVKAQVLGLIPIFDRVARSTKTSIESAAKAEVRAQQDASKQIAAAAQATEKGRERAIKETFRVIERSLKDEQRARDAASALSVRAFQQAEREKTRESETASRQRQRIAQQEAQAAEATLRRRSRGFGTAIGSATGRVMGTAGRVAGVAAAIGGGFSIADALREGVESQASAGQIVRSSASNKAGFTGKDINTKLGAETLALGIKKEDVSAGLDAFIQQSGDLDAGVEMIRKLGEISATTGAAMVDLGLTAGDAFNKLGNSKDTIDVMMALAGQGKAGALDIRQLGQYGPRLTASARMFEGPVPENIKLMGAVGQIARKTGVASSAEEATQAVAHVGIDIAKNAQSFKDVGVNVFADKAQTTLRPLMDIFAEAMTATKGSLPKNLELFGLRSEKAVEGIRSLYTGKGGGPGGVAGIRQGFAEVRASEMTQGDLDAGVKSKLQEDAAQLTIATRKYNDAVNRQLLPLMPSLIDKFTRLIPPLERFLQWIIDSPKTAIGVIIGGAIAAELGKGAVSGAVAGVFSGLARKALELVTGGGGKAPQIPGLGVSAPTPGAPTGVLGTAAAALAITATAVTITAAGVTIIDAAFAAKQEADKKVRAAIIEGSNAEGAVRAGLPGSKEAAEENLARLKSLDAGSVRATESPLAAGLKGGLLSMLGPVGGAVGGLLDAAGNAFSPVGGLKNTFEGAANYATAGSVGRSFSKIAEDEAAARAAGQVKEQLDKLAAAVESSTTSVIAFGEGLPKPNSGKDPPGVPQPPYGNAGGP